MLAGECSKRVTIFSKNAEGQTSTAQIGQMTCRDQVSDTFCCLILDVRLSPGPCEDSSSTVTPQLNGILHAIVEVIRDRKSRRGCFSGNWQLSGDNGVVAAAGELSGTVGAGTHRAPAAPQDCEKCLAPEHYEGKLTGQVLLQGEFLGAEICATLSGMGPLGPPPPPPAVPTQFMAIEGVLISCCPN